MLTHGEIIKTPFVDAGFNVYQKLNALTPPYDGNCWPITFPEDIKWNDDTVVIIHLQDFVTIKNNACPELEKIEQHYGERANRVIVVHWTLGLQNVYNGPLNLIYFPTHSYDLLLNLKKNQNEWLPNLSTNPTKNWQCLNGTKRRHRELIAYYMQKSFSNGVLSLGEDIPLPEWSFSTYFGCENELNWMRLLPIYNKCKLNIVTETQYYETPGIITEKTIMALLGLQVPVVIGYKGIVTDCINHGFDMFTDIVNVSYEFYDDRERWKAAIDLNEDIINGNYDWNLIINRLKTNQDYVLNQWPDILVEQFNNNARDIALRLHQSG